TLRTGMTLRLDPPGRDVRVRALHVFGKARDVVSGGARVAVNVPAVDVDELGRGAVLADRTFAPRASYRVRFRPAAGAMPLLRRRTPVRAHLGAAEIMATLVFDAPPNRLSGGGERAGEPVRSTGDGRDAQSEDRVSELTGTLFLRRPVPAYPGEAYVVRALSPKRLLGGGTLDVAGAASSAPSAAEADASTEARAANGNPDTGAIVTDAPDVCAIAEALRASGLTPTAAAEIGARANVREERAAEILAELASRGDARRLQRPLAYVDGAAADALSSRILATLRRREADTPWILGTTSLALARELAVDEPFLVRFLHAEAEDGRIASRAGYFSTPAHEPRLSAEQRAFFETVVPVDPAQPLAPAPLDIVVLELRRSRVAGLAQAFDTLIATGALVKVGADVYRGTQIAQIRGKLADAIRRNGPITMAAFRDAVGTTRKYAVPLMEWFDATGVTIRDGDRRTLRTRKPA